MAALHINDASTWRRIQSVYVNDVGTWRTIQKIYVNDAGTWRQVYTRRPAESGSLTVASSGMEVGCCRVNFGNGVFGNITGFPGGFKALSDANAVDQISEDINGFSYLRIKFSGGINTTPAQNYFQSITVNGFTVNSSAASFVSGGVGQYGWWTWAGRLWGLQAALGTTVGVTINF